jgi:pimeloyl-ACP methyl ester carboxylesterase
MAIKCAYSVRGAGPPLLMVHGIGSHREGWRSVIDELEGDYTCITFDLRGHGTSPIPDEPFSIDDLVDDVLALTNELRLTRFHLVGHSLGAMVAAAYTREFPDRVITLGMFSTAAFRNSEDQNSIRAVVSKIKSDGIADNLDGLIHRWFTDDFLLKHPEFVKRRKEHLKGMDQKVLLNVFEIYSKNEMGPWLNEIKPPTLIVTGEFDPGCSPRLNRRIAEAIPLSKLSILKGLKHSILVEGAASLSEAIRTFHASPVGTKN